MASYEELSMDWNTLCQECTNWTKSDLQLAAELGKTLLERNKELESTLKHSQGIIDDQAQEIEYLQKQTAALREVNDSRLRIYEQLEVSIQDLERQNHRLVVENANEKKHNKTLLNNIDNLESKCEDLTKSLDEGQKNLNDEKRRNERLLQQRNNENENENSVRFRKLQSYSPNADEPDSVQTHKYNGSSGDDRRYASKNSTGNASVLETSLDVSHITSEENEEIIKIMTEMEVTKKALISEQQRVTELEEQLVAIIQENQTLQSRIVQASTNEDMKSVHEELSILEEVRQGTMCSRCLRSVDDRNAAIDDGSSMIGTEDGEDDRSLMELINTAHASQNYRSEVTIKMSPKPNTLDLSNTSSNNPYRELVEKYEALLEVQRHPIVRVGNQRSAQTGSIQEPLQSPNIYSTPVSKQYKQTDDKDTTLTLNENSATNGSNGGASILPGRKSCRRTPTDFSEAETSSSGFSDETSNKGTQTEERQGYFLCSIGDGEDCKFSIYDDASPIDSRFRNRPEYRELFKEIFAVLKKAAENKEEGESLPLLDDTHPVPPTISKVPPVTPANEELPDFGDDTQSIISSVISEQSIAMSECITKTERKTAAKKHIVEKGQENRPPSSLATVASGTGLSSGKQIAEDGRVLVPLKREPLEYLSVSVGVKKKNRKKHRNMNSDRSDSPALPSPPRVCFGSGKKRRDMRPFNTSFASSTETPNTTVGHEWNGNSMIIYNRNMQSPSASSNCSPRSHGTPCGNMSEIDITGVQFRPSTASQDLHKLKKLDLSYAEVLRRADSCKHHHRRK